MALLKLHVSLSPSLLGIALLSVQTEVLYVINSWHWPLTSEDQVNQYVSTHRWWVRDGSVIKTCKLAAVELNMVHLCTHFSKLALHQLRLSLWPTRGSDGYKLLICSIALFLNEIDWCTNTQIYWTCDSIQHKSKLRPANCRTADWADWLVVEVLERVGLSEERASAFGESLAPVIVLHRHPSSLLWWDLRAKPQTWGEGRGGMLGAWQC